MPSLTCPPAKHPQSVWQRLAATSDAEVISRRIKTVLASVPLKKLVVALRKQDFNTELQLEAAIELLGQATGVTQFAVHKLDIYTQE